MKVRFRTEVLPEEWWWDPENPVTGTTKFYVRVAEEAVKDGHSVCVEQDGPEREVRGVRYVHRGGPAADLTIDCNFSVATDSSGGRRIAWTSFYNRPDFDGTGYDRLFYVSDFVRSTVSAKCPTEVIELGTDFETVSDVGWRGPFCCYTASPDRGLRFLMDMWPRVEARTGYGLLCTPYGGATSSQVRDILDRSRFWVFPAIGTDSICAALEAQARGCIPFVVPHMGLPETLRYGVRTDLHRFERDLVDCLNRDRQPLLDERARALAARPLPRWSDVWRRLCV